MEDKYTEFINDAILNSSIDDIKDMAERMQRLADICKRFLYIKEIREYKDKKNGR